MADVSDNFNRASENPLSNGGKWVIPVWSSLAQLATNGSAVYSTVADQSGYALWIGNGFQDNQFSQCFVPASGNFSYMYLFVRANTGIGGDLQNSYGLAIHTHVNSISFIYKTVNGVGTNLGATIPDSCNGKTIKLEVSGSTITATIGAATYSRSDSDILFGYPGIGRNSHTTSSGSTIDNWVGGPIRVARTSSPIPAGTP